MINIYIYVSICLFTENDLTNAIRIIPAEPSDILNQPVRSTTIVQTTPANLSEPGLSTVLCTQQQRLSRMDEMCRRYNGSAASQHSQNAFIDGMSDAEIVQFSEYLFDYNIVFVW